MHSRFKIQNTRRRRQVVEEEVTSIISDDRSFEAVVQEIIYLQGDLDQEQVPEEMNYEQNRRDSFSSWWLDNFELDDGVAHRLTKAGFYCSGFVTKCFSCELSESPYFWQDGHDPQKVHSKRSPDCLFVKGKSNNVPIETKQYNNVEFLSQTSSTSALKPEKTDHEKFYKLKPLKDKLPNQINNVTNCNKEEIKLQEKTNGNYGKTNQNRQIQERIGSRRYAQQRKSGFKQHLSEKPYAIPRSFSPPDVISDSSRNARAKNVQTTSVTDTGSSSSEFRKENFISSFTPDHATRDTGASTAEMHEDISETSALQPIKEKAISATKSGYLDIEKETSTNECKCPQEWITSESSMLVMQKRRVVEEEVTEVISDNSSFEAVVEEIINLQGDLHQEQVPEEMNYEQNRRDSFSSWWLDNFELDDGVAHRLTKAGFYCSGFVTKCFSCELSESPYFWQDGHEPDKIHREKRPDCLFVKGKSNNVPIEMKPHNNAEFLSQTPSPRVSKSDRHQQVRVSKFESLDSKSKKKYIKVDRADNRYGNSVILKFDRPDIINRKMKISF